VVYGASHRAGQLGETGPSQPTLVISLLKMILLESFLLRMRIVGTDVRTYAWVGLRTKGCLDRCARRVTVAQI
jgi:hypothetical protein